MAKLYNFKRDNGTGFEFYFEKELGAGEEIILKMPPISANKRAINDIAWQSENSVTIYATLSSSLNTALWSVLDDGDEINKCAQFIKIVANDGGKVYVRINLY